MNSTASTPNEKALLEAYEDWRRLTELEGEGIRARDWTLVTDCQNRLAALQTRMIRLTSDARAEWRRTGMDLSEKESNLRHTISNLMELEMANRPSLNATKEAARAKLEQLHSARQNLKRVERTYSSTGSAGWNSYS